MELYKGDCMEVLRALPARSVDLVLTDPPYNIGKDKTWDKIKNYQDWTAAWMTECARVLKDNGSMVFFHNDMPQIAGIMERMREAGEFDFVSFCVWDKGKTYRRRSWAERRPDGKTAMRSWFNRCEYVLEYAKRGSGAKSATGLARINSNPQCYKPLKEWYAAECARLGLTVKDIGRKYTEVTGRKPYMLRHYFCDSQFEIPTQATWESVYMPLGFAKPYEALRQEYEALRYYHQCDAEHSNVWRRKNLEGCEKASGHPCEKPVDILERIVRVSCRPGGTVLDPFMGGGSTGVAAWGENREFIGIERDEHWFETARNRIARATKQTRLM